MELIHQSKYIIYGNQSGEIQKKACPETGSARDAGRGRRNLTRRNGETDLNCQNLYMF